MLQKAGACVIDADQISRDLTKENGTALPILKHTFGEDIFDGNVLNRKKLGALIFHNKEKRTLLNRTLHPLVFAKMKEALQQAEHEKVVILDVPLLFETKVHTWCDEIWCAYLSEEKQIKRLMGRDQCTKTQALQKINSQMDREKRAAQSDHIIDTSGSKKKSAESVISLYHALLERI